MKYTILIPLFFISRIFYAQNLVPNPSFEEYEECPNSHSEFEGMIISWQSWQGSPDYFNACNNTLSGVVGIPNNVYGHQYPMTGVAYAAIYTATHSAIDGREYIATPLITPLEIGETYYTFLHTSFFDGTLEPEIWCAANHLGMRFFKNPNYNSIDNPFQADNFCHVQSNDIITDTTNWTKIDGWFVADDSYDWLAIGNFYQDSQTDTVLFNSDGYCFAIYYIENVCVAKTPEECDYLLNIRNDLNKFDVQVYPNPVSDKVTIRSPKDVIQKIQVIDSSGRIIKTFPSIDTNTIEINLEPFSPGVYLFQIESNNHLSNHKIIIQ